MPFRTVATMSFVRLAIATCIAGAVTFVTMPVVFADRLSDKDVKSLMERIDNERDRFEDQLDGSIKSKILRGPGGEVNVERFLDDLQNNVDRMKERFTSEYAASAEVTTVLRQGTDIQRFMSTQPPDLDGASWANSRRCTGRQCRLGWTTTPGG
jgi:hypothetical protein